MHLIRDLRFGLRTLGKSRGLTTVAVATFALGIGLTTTMYSIVHGALRNLPFEEPEELLHLERNHLERGIDSMEVTLHDFRDWQRMQQSFEGLSGFYSGTANLADGSARPERHAAAFLSANAFELLGVEARLGRTFAADEEGPGAPSVVILGHDLWQNRYGGEESILGSTVRINAEPHTVIGVMPEGFEFPIRQDLWLPLTLDADEIERGEGITLEVFGRLVDGASLDRAAAEMATIADQLAREHPETNQGISTVVKPYTEEFIGEEATSLLYTMFGAVLFVLLIACANVANLLLARAAGRSKEVALRSALGAGRGRVIGQMLTETVLLAAGGAVAGLGLTFLGVEIFNRSLPDVDTPFWIDIRVDPQVLVFATGLTLAAALLAGLVPAWRASGGNLHEVLKDDSPGSSSLRMGRLSKALVVVEVTLSCALLVGAGLSTKSIVGLSGHDYGFDTERVLTARLGLFEADYPDTASRLAFFEELERRLEAIPEVSRAAIATAPPVAWNGRQRFLRPGDDPSREADHPLAQTAWVSPGFFETLEVAVEGRGPERTDRTDSLPAVIVNRPFAERHFPGESPLGERIRLLENEGEEEPVWRTIVGVAPDLHMAGVVNEEPEGIYIPLAQGDARFATLLVRTEGDPKALVPAVRRAVLDLDPNLPLYWVRTMPEVIAEGAWFVQVFGTLFMIFGAVALVLAAVGLYGVMSFAVGRRTHEVGVRMALGARAGQVLRLVLRQGAHQLVLGLVLGLGLSALLSRFLEEILIRVEPWDPVIFLAIVAVLALAGMAACLVPARRAARVEPAVALRYE